ncbi:helix-turn-helix domain-containing protein [Pseudonocardia sp. GCM10023141]|uniref:helix-turn-helix domain-containing protein n=1 Tax=Pseudonocardia sp. GCM10023141 TaxID=3252653 RepID=UPI00361E50D9
MRNATRSTIPPYIEYHTVNVQAGYLDEVSRIRRDRETEVTILLSDFLGRSRIDHALTMRVARTLALAADDRFLVAAAAGSAIATVRSRLSIANGRAQVHPRGDAVMILIPGPQPTHEVSTWADDIPLALSPVVDSLAGVPAAWRIAHGLLIATPSGSRNPRTLSEGRPFLIDTMLPDLAETIRTDAIGQLRALTPESQRQICATTETYMRTGSLLETSQLLYCHRNTVLKRLGRFRDLTGLDPTVPWDAATIRLALSAIDREATGDVAGPDRTGKARPASRDELPADVVGYGLPGWRVDESTIATISATAAAGSRPPRPINDSHVRKSTACRAAATVTSSPASIVASRSATPSA